MSSNRYTNPRFFSGNPLKKKEPKGPEYSGKLGKEDLSYLSLVTGEIVRFYRDGVLMQGKIEHLPTTNEAMDKVLVFAHPVSSPSTKHSYRVNRYELKSWSVWDEKGATLTSPVRSYSFTVKVEVEVAKKTVEIELRGIAEASSSSEALNKLLSTEKFEITVTNAIGLPYTYNGTWGKLKEKAHRFDVTSRIVKPKPNDNENNEQAA